MLTAQMSTTPPSKTTYSAGLCDTGVSSLSGKTTLLDGRNGRRRHLRPASSGSGGWADEAEYRGCRLLEPVELEWIGERGSLELALVRLGRVQEEQPLDQRRLLAPERGEEGRCASSRRIEIDDGKIECLAPRAGECGRAIRCRRHPEATQPSERLHAAAHRGVRRDEEHADAIERRRCREHGRNAAVPLSFGIERGKRDAKHRPFGAAPGNRDRAAVRRDDAVAHAETQPGA